MSRSLKDASPRSKESFKERITSYVMALGFIAFFLAYIAGTVWRDSGWWLLTIIVMVVSAVLIAWMKAIQDGFPVSDHKQAE